MLPSPATFFGNEVGKKLCGRASHFFNRLAHAGERRMAHFAGWGAVETDDGKVFRHAEIEVLSDLHALKGDVVGPDKEGGRSVFGGKQGYELFW